MLGMNLLSFLILTFIGTAVASVYHHVIRYRFLEGNDAMTGKVIMDGLARCWVRRCWARWGPSRQFIQTTFDGESAGQTRKYVVGG